MKANLLSPDKDPMGAAITELFSPSEGRKTTCILISV